MNFFDEIFRPLTSIILVLLIPYIFFLIRFVIQEVRDMDETMHDMLRVLKEMRDHEKGIKRKKVKSD